MLNITAVEQASKTCSECAFFVQHFVYSEHKADGLSGYVKIMQGHCTLKTASKRTKTYNSYNGFQEMTPQQRELKEFIEKYEL